MQSVMKHTFSQVPSAQIPRSKFDRSHGYKTTFNSGLLIPVFLDEALPGDDFSLRMSAFARLATPIVPLMDNMFLDSFFFAVPIRLVWDNWQKFNGEQIDPGDSTDYLTPVMTSPIGGYQPLSIHDYFGLPTQVAGITHQSLWHRAYNLIWNEWFRDQNLQDSVPVPKGDGPDSPSDFTLLRRGKRHDYFTSALPWPQKGPSVTLPLGTSAPVIGIGKATNVFGEVDASVLQSGDNSSVVYPFSAQIDNSAGNTTWYGKGTGATGVPDITVDLSQATAATINALRSAFQIQKLYERDARGGTRYTEIIRSHFGVVSPDARLQRPEYLGGGSTNVNIHPVPQTAPTETATTPQGNLAAFGTASIGGHGFTKGFTEHTLILGLVMVRADLNYQQGLNRMFSRRTRWDYYWPALSHIGEQAVLNKEIYAQGTSVDDDPFGYQERYAEYRYKPSTITGYFRSNYSQSLDVWHLAQDFSTLPALNSSFIQENPPIQRVIAVPGEVEFLFDSYMKLQTARPMPVYSVPGLIDHF
ncbi:MAG: major capsid protein [Arizlama microvirus]|nr:MAG: major capsid protein [Arizlama microvirus]